MGKTTQDKSKTARPNAPASAAAKVRAIAELREEGQQQQQKQQQRGRSRKQPAVASDANDGADIDIESEDVKRPRTRVKRLYSAKTKQVVTEDGTEHVKRRSTMRNRVGFYQNSKHLSISTKTFGKALIQRCDILTDCGMLKKDRDVKNPSKKPSKRRTVDDDDAESTNIVKRFSISKQALLLAQRMYAEYLIGVMKKAQIISKRVTVSAEELDKAIMMDSSVGPRWGLILKPNTDDDNNNNNNNTNGVEGQSVQ